MDDPTFRYQPQCSAPGCDQPGIYKVASEWSFGASRELKNYGICCQEHRELLHRRAVAAVAALALAEGEKVGPVGFYRLLPGVRDAALNPAD